MLDIGTITMDPLFKISGIRREGATLSLSSVNLPNLFVGSLCPLLQLLKQSILGKVFTSHCDSAQLRLVFTDTLKCDVCNARLLLHNPRNGARTAIANHFCPELDFRGHESCLKLANYRNYSC